MKKVPHHQLPENDPKLKSFLDIDPTSDFPIQNLPFGIFCPSSTKKPRAGVAIGDWILDLSVLEEQGLLRAIFPTQQETVFNKISLNAFMSLGQAQWRTTRALISRLLRHDEPLLRDNKKLRQTALIARNQVEMLMPIKVEGFTDFYSSKEHATNLGLLFRGKENPLLPNWLHMPIAYDGRANSLVVSGTAFHRPNGQIKPNDTDPPIYTASQKLDTEVELAYLIGMPSTFGTAISVAEAPQHIFGMTLLADWSARDIQKWEYVPLGPFLGKNFCTTLSPWIVSLDALEPFRVPGVTQEPQPLPYLQSERTWNYDITLELLLQTEKMSQPHLIAKMNARGIYWDFCQQLAHHTVNGCPMQTGDVFATGTISGSTPDSFGSLIELTWGGSKPIQLPNGEQRTFLLDGDQLIIRGYCEGNNYRVGFGSLTGKILPAH